MRLQRQGRFLLSLLVLSLWLSACTLPMRLEVSAAKAVSINDFAEQLGTALVQHDYAQLQSAMGHDFVLANWGSEGRAVPPAVAIIQLRNHYLSAGSAAALPNKVDWTKLLDGHDPLTLWDRQVQAAKAIYVTGLGADQQDEALLIVAQQADGTPYWSSMLVAPGGFPANVDTIAKNAAVVPATALAMVKTSAVTADTVTASVRSAAAIDSRYIVFEPGATTAAVRGVLPAQASKEYLVRALAGQLVIVELASPTGGATFTISGVDDGQVLNGSDKETKLWRGSVPSTQDYLITVTAPAVTPYELAITFDPRQAPTTAEAAPVRLIFAAGSSTATTTDHVAAPERQRYLVRGVAGQTLQIALTPTDGSAIFAVQGVTDGKPLKRLANTETRWSSTLPVTQDYLITVTPTGAAVAYTLALAVE